jgi:glycosyltransferase involved in cell wall biosynthesis
MRILQVAPCLLYSWGGSASQVKDISRQLVKRGHEVTIYTSDGSSEAKIQDIDGVKIYFFPVLNSNNAVSTKFFITPTLRKMLKREIRNFDVVHIHEFRTFQNIIVHTFAKKFNIPYVLEAHGGLPKVEPKRQLKFAFDFFFGNRILNEASQVVALSEKEAQQFKGSGLLDAKIQIIPNGLDLSKYITLPPHGSFKNKFHIAQENRIILCLGRINKKKGIEFLIKAFAAICKNSKFANCILVLAGRNDGHLKTIKSLIDSLGLTKKVIIAGFLSEEDKTNAYVDSDIVANVEPENVFGLVPLEAAACSVPVIVCKSNDVSEVVREGNLGLTVEYNNYRELTKTMEILLNNNEKKVRTENPKGRKYVFENYDWPIIIPKLESMYESLSVNVKK